MSRTPYLDLNIPDKSSKGFVVTDVFEPNFTKLDQEAERVNLRKMSTEDNVEELKKANRYKLGDVVEVLGYHTKGDGSHHKRVAKATNDGSGEQGQNGIWWCIVHSGEVNASWFGAKATDELQNFIQKAMQINAIKKINITFDCVVSNMIQIRKKDLELDFNGYKITDNITSYFVGTNANRAHYLFNVAYSENITIKNFVYESTDNRATLQGSAPDILIGVAIHTEPDEHSENITLENITFKKTTKNSMPICFSGGTSNIFVRNIKCLSDSTFGINFEYGDIPTQDGGGRHPNNAIVENFRGYNMPSCQGFLRVASCYNIKFINCKGENVSNFIYCYGGDRNITEFSENVIFSNCVSRYILSNVNYVCSIVIPNKDGSTGEDLPSWTNYDHMFLFDNCQFKNNSNTNQYGVRFFGNKGKVIFNNCILENNEIGVRAEPSLNPNYSSRGTLVFRDCIFKNNIRDIKAFSYNGLLIENCKFKSVKSGLSNIILTESSNNIIENCTFYANGDVKILAENTSFGNVFNNNSFENDNVEPILTANFNAGANNNLFPSIVGNLVSQNSYKISGEITTYRKEIDAEVLDFNKASIFYSSFSTKTIKSCINARIGDTITVSSESASNTINIIQDDTQGNNKFVGSYILSGYKSYDFKKIEAGWIPVSIPTSGIATSLDTPYYALKMQQEGIYEDYVAYRDEVHEYENSQTADETMLLPVLQEPIIPESVELFAKKYNLI